MTKRQSISLVGRRPVRTTGALLACVLLSGISIASSPPLRLASSAVETGHETATKSHASAGSTLPQRSETGPRTYPISEVFLNTGIPEPTPTPKPTPPPEAFAKPVLEPYRPPELFGTPFYDTDASTRTVIPFRLPRPTPRPTPKPKLTPPPVQTPKPTPRIRKPAPRATHPKDSAPTQDAPLDLNAASAGELARIPGLGPHRAKLIVAHRQTIGGFEHLHQLLDVFGISEERFAEATPLLTVTSPAPQKSQGEKQPVPRTRAALPELDTSAATTRPSSQSVLALP